MKKHVTRIAQNLASKHGRSLDLHRDYTFGKGGAKSFIDQHRTTRNVSFSIANDSDAPQLVVVGKSLFSVYQEDNALTIDLGANAVLGEGTILTTPNGNVTATGNDPNRKLEYILRRMSLNPTVITSISLQSRVTATSAPDTSNFEGQLQTVFVDPYSRNEVEYLPLRKFQSNAANSPEFLNIDLLKENFNVQISSETFLIISVNPKTTLSVVMGIGSELSLAQKSYRNNKEANNILNAIRKVGS